MKRRRGSAFGISFLLHVLAVATAVSVGPRLTLRSAARGHQPHLTVITVAASAGATSADAADPPHALSAEDDFTVEYKRGRPPLDLPGFQFDVAKVANRARELFPFLWLRLPLERVEPDRGRTMTRLLNPFGRGTRPSRKPPLAMDDAVMQSLVDRAWSRRDRWVVFQPLMSLAHTFDPDEGQLPALLRRYVDQTMLQPYLDSSIRDARLWAELGIAAEHADYIAFIREYASAHPSTKATTELLFLLDKLAQGSYDALVTLVNAGAFDLKSTWDIDRDAFDFIVALQRHFRTELALRGLTPPAALRAHYEAIRIIILNSILDVTPDGYRAADARFLLGSLSWRAGDVPSAVRWWRGMTVDASDVYASACSDILEVLRDAGPAGERIDRGRINSILDAEQQRWLKFWDGRLRRFGYAFDKF